MMTGKLVAVMAGQPCQGQVEVIMGSFLHRLSLFPATWGLFPPVLPTWPPQWGLRPPHLRLLRREILNTSIVRWDFETEISIWIIKRNLCTFSTFSYIQLNMVVLELNTLFAEICCCILRSTVREKKLLPCKVCN